MDTINYLRKGRKLRATGTIIDGDHPTLTKVQPSRAGWASVWVTPEEIAAGAGKSAFFHRVPQDVPPRKRKPRTPPAPRWCVLLGIARGYSLDSHPALLPPFPMSLVIELANELESARLEISQLLPISKP